jgi:hypothetical protein
MLGAGRASQYAAWWNTGLQAVDFSSTSVLSTSIYQSPTYSWLGNSTTGEINGIDTGEINLTGLTGFTGFNNLRSVRVTHMYFPSSVWTSAANAGIVFVPTADLNNSDTQYPYQWQISLDTISGVKQLIMNYIFLSFNGSGSIALPGAHTQYLDTWLTCVAATAETSTVFTSWSNPPQGSNDQATRVAVFNTATGALIAKSDAWRNSTTSSPAWPTLSTITNPLPLESGAAWYMNYGLTTQPGYDSRIAGDWLGFGTMFDPLTETNTSWRTALPAELIGNAQSWMNVQFSRSSNVSGTQFFGTASNQDLYSQASNNQITFSQVGSQAQFDANYSDTIIIKDSS